MILETERLMLREMTQSDFDDLAEMLCDPEVMYAYERDFSDEDVRQWLDNQLSRYKKYGFGMWSVILKQSGNMIGQAGITMQLQGRRAPRNRLSVQKSVLAQRICDGSGARAEKLRFSDLET